MFPNLLFIPVLILSYIFYRYGQEVVKKYYNSKKVYYAFLLLFFVFSIPGFSMILHYTGIFENSAWYYQFRSIYFTEFLLVFIGFFGGMLKQSVIKHPQAKKKTSKIYTLFLFFLISIPFLKPILLPVGLTANWQNKWENNVCIQSSLSTCGPCAASTIFKKYGKDMPEKEIAQRSYSSLLGTEIWYIARVFTANHFDVTFKTNLTEIDEVKSPAIIGVVSDKGMGHFITYLSNINDKYIIGDSLIGQLTLSKEEFNQQYIFTGFAMEVKVN